MPSQIFNGALARLRLSISSPPLSTLRHARTSHKSQGCLHRSRAAPSSAKIVSHIFLSTITFARQSPLLLHGSWKVCIYLDYLSTWADLSTVANVPDAETEFHAHEFLDATIQPRPIWISPNEVYSMHRLLSQYLNQLVQLTSITRRDDG